MIEKAFLVSVYKNSSHKTLSEEHLEELAFLTDTFGAEVVGKISYLARKFEAATYLTSGKIEELIELCRSSNATVIIIDDEIAPSQQRNLEELFKIPVMDRTELILKVFAQRAQTKEAQLQIALAKIKYEAPRLKRLWTHLSRQQGSAGGGSGGGGGYLKGEGEKQIEIDRRILKKKIEVLQEELEEVRLNRELQRSSRERSGIPTFAIVGYTNAGKSSLLNALTDAEVFVENKLFATLDTTTRKLTLPNNQDVLLIDTVGFIRKLPHLLVAAFKSTLEEAVFSNILIHLVDISHPDALDHAEVAFEVLKDLEAGSRPIIHVLNKIDLVQDRLAVMKFKVKYPRTVEISVKTGQGMDDLLEMMMDELKKQRKKVTLRIPQSEYGVASDVMKLGTVIKTDYDENDVIITAELPFAVASKLSRFETK
jgi:GTPase